ncbi:MAG: hypothetical protein HY644_01730 [Acidobacteria bacterium]|nr:hypothetical protein [Acidobacteriota bacterium]
MKKFSLRSLRFKGPAFFHRSTYLLVALLLVTIIEGRSLAAALLGNLGVVVLAPVLMARNSGATESSLLPSRANLATEYLSLAVSVRPERKELDPLVAIAGFEAGDLIRGAEAFSRGRRAGSLGVRLGSEDYRFHVLLGKVLENAGQFENAIAEYRLGLSAGAGRLVPAHYRAYYETLAQAYMKGILVADNPVQADYLVARWLWMADHRAAAAAWFEKLPGNVPQDRHSNPLSRLQLARVQAYLGQRMEDQKKFASAATHYAKAIQIAPEFAPAWLRLARLDGILHSSATSLAYRRVMDLQPDFVVGRPLPSGWILEGYTLDRESLEAGPCVEMIFFWRKTDSTVISLPGQQIAQDRWAQEGVRVNLAPNGGFEWLPFDSRGVAGYSQEAYGGVTSPRVMLKRRNGEMTHVLGLLHQGVTRSSGLISYPFSVNAGAVYLATAWSYGEEGFGGFGVNWVGKGEIDYTPCNSRTGQWFPCAGLHLPPTGATKGQIWILQYKTPYDVYFDDLLCVQLSMN